MPERYTIIVLILPQQYVTVFHYSYTNTFTDLEAVMWEWGQQMSFLLLKQIPAAKWLSLEVLVIDLIKQIPYGLI